MTDEKRKGFLDTLLGKKEATDVRATLTKAAEALDAAKVARKEEVVTEAPATSAPGVDEITAAIGQMLTNAGIADDIVNKAVEAVKAALAPTAADTPVEEVVEVKSLVKSLGDLVGEQTKDNGLIAQAVVDIATAIKELTKDNAAANGRLTAIEKALGDRPRQASKAAETEVENSELATKIKEGIDGDMSFLGVKISKPLPSKENGNGQKG